MQSITISQAKHVWCYQVGEACAALLTKDAAVSLMSSTSTKHFSPILFGKKMRVILFLLPPFLISFFFSYYCNCFQKTLTFRLLPCALFQWAQCCSFNMHKRLGFLACADGAWTRNWEVFILMIGAWLSCIPEPSWALGEECLPGLFLAASVRWAEPQ